MSFFDKFKPKAEGETIVLNIQGMHCTSCSLNIDNDLEDLPGVIKASTSYARSTTSITYDPEIITQKQIIKTIVNLGYSIW